MLKNNKQEADFFEEKTEDEVLDKGGKSKDNKKKDNIEKKISFKERIISNNNILSSYSENGKSFWKTTKITKKDKSNVRKLK